MICLVVDQVNTYISLVLGTGSGRSPFFVNIKIYTYYAKKHERTRVFIPSSPYLFPFLVDDRNKSQDKTIDKKKATVRLYRNAEARISYHLRMLATKIGIKGKLTLYVARHSWATAARDTISLSQSSARHWDIILKSPHKSISAPSKAQKWMMPMPGYWQFYKPKKE